MSTDKIFLNIVLVLLYFYLFGYNSLLHYLAGGVIIKRNSLVTEDIKQPGIIIVTGGPNILPTKLRQSLREQCEGRVREDLRYCVENITSTYQRVVVNTSHTVYQESFLIQFGLGKITRYIIPIVAVS